VALVLPLAFFERPALELAPLLLNKVLAHGPRRARILEVEAYGGEDDPASHAARGPTPRNASMFGPAGRLYVYRIYGLHHCANVVSGPGASPGAVLLRALWPLAGVGAMRRARGGGDERVLCAGPGRLCVALGLDRTHDGADLTDPSGPVVLTDDGTSPPERPLTGPRIGITRARDAPWRFAVPGAVGLSRPLAPLPSGP